MAEVKRLVSTSPVGKFARLCARVGAQFALRGGIMPIAEIKQAARDVDLSDQTHELLLFVESCMGARVVGDTYQIPALANREASP
jgi:hypothetical protein